DHLGFQVRYEKLTVCGIESDIAETRASVFSSIQADRGEKFGRESIRTAKVINCRRTAFTPLAGQPIGVVIKTMQPEGGRGSKVDVDRVAIVNRDAEHLTDFARCDLQMLRLIGPVPAIGDEAGVADIDSAADDAFLVQDDGACSVI